MAIKSATKPKGEQQAKLTDLGIDFICDRIENGDSVAQLATTLKMTRQTLWNWIDADVGRSARVRESLKRSAIEYDDKAELVLKNLPKDATNAQIMQARELASHYRWRASKRDPKAYGDKLGLSGELEVKMTDDQLNNRLAFLLRKAGADAAPGGEAASHES